MKIQPQRGLGDLIFALPLIYDITRRESVEVATNHPEALILAAEWGDITTSGVTINSAGISEKKEGFVQLKYNRYGPGFFTRYYTPHSVLPLEESIHRVRASYSIGVKLRRGEYAVFAPPRAARRHIGTENELLCAPDGAAAARVVESYNLPVVVVGQDDVYAPDVRLPAQSTDIRGKLDLVGLFAVIAGATCVISQASAITAIAGLYAIPTHFLKAACETDDQHAAHVSGIVWPGQSILV